MDRVYPDSGDPETTTFAYDARNRLVEVARGPPGDSEILGQYDYDHGGLRIRVRGSSRNTDSFYDGLSLVEEYNADSGDLLAHYRYDGMGLHSIETIGEGGFAQHQFVHRDILGTTMALSGPMGAAEALYRTDPWGQVTDIWTPEVDDWASGDPFPTINHNIYTGHQHDEGTGLIYARARYLDPEIGRFLTQDTYLGEAMNPPSLHRYNYGPNNPTGGTDPTGNIWKTCNVRGESFRTLITNSCQNVADDRLVQQTAAMDDCRSRGLEYPIFPGNSLDMNRTGFFGECFG